MDQHTPPSFQLLMKPGSGSWYLSPQSFPVALAGSYDCEINCVEFSSTETTTPSVLSLRSSVIQSYISPTVGYSFGVNSNNVPSGFQKKYNVNGVQINGHIDIQIYDNTAGNYSSDLIQGMQFCLITLTLTPSKFMQSTPNNII